MNLLNETSDSKFVTANYDEGDETTYKKKVLQSNLRVWNDGYILIRSNITVQTAPVT